MKRRHILGAVSAALAAPVPLAFARSTSRLRVGVSLPITSVQSSVAADLQFGLAQAFARSRVKGLPIEVEWEDDRSQPDATAAAIDRFGKDGSFLATTSIVGTPHAIKALPVARRHELPVIGLRSGASELRDGRPGVFHLRASFDDELTRMLRFAQVAGLRRVAVVYSDDAFGNAAIAHVRAVAPGLLVQVVAAEAAERNGGNITAVVDRVLRGDGAAPDALLMAVIADPMQRGVRQAREVAHYRNPVFAMSFCGTRGFAESKEPHLLGLGLTSAVPLPRVDMATLSQAFVREAVAANSNAADSLSSFEGYLYGSVLAAALERAQEPTRAAVVAALKTPLDVGGFRVAFDERNVGYRWLKTLHKGLDGRLRA